MVAVFKDCGEVKAMFIQWSATVLTAEAQVVADPPVALIMPSSIGDTV